MCDSHALKVMFVFEAAARLKYGSEVSCLAARIFHKYLRLKLDSVQCCDPFTFAAASLKLANWFYEMPVSTGELALVTISIVHENQYFPEASTIKSLEKSIELAARVMAINLDFHINYKADRMMTPGQLAASRAQNMLKTSAAKPLHGYSNKDDEFGDEHDEEDDPYKALAKNNRHLASAHRYLAHYLKAISMLVEPVSQKQFRRLCNLAWTLLSDFHWSPKVIHYNSNHLACACLLMAVRISRNELTKSGQGNEKLWTLVNRHWNLILCNDLPNEHMHRYYHEMINLYKDFERALEHDINAHVIGRRSSIR